MADDESKGVVRQFLAAIKGGDGQTMMSLLAEDAVVVLPARSRSPGRADGRGGSPSSNASARSGRCSTFATTR